MREFFELIPTLFCEVKRGFFRPLKNCSFGVCKFPCLGWRSAIFLQGVLSPKNICNTCANILVLDLRFLCCYPLFLSLHCRTQSESNDTTLVLTLTKGKKKTIFLRFCLSSHSRKEIRCLSCQKLQIFIISTFYIL
jgi:hypothetical protein